MADLLTMQQITELKEAFAVFDKDSDGSITVEDLGEVFEAIGQKVSRKKLQLMMAEADLDANGVIDFPEFLTLVATKLNDPEEKELELRRAFSIYDLGKTGFINVTDLKFVMGRLGCPLSTEQAFEMVNEADIDGDGRLSFNEFRRVMNEGWP
ncbi:putative calmodulin [Trypanosoma cruzi]|uniref:Calmodulin, putative n=2 Tax=Trypanosoma cruzi TaxID=5693 RepID=Q4DB21_TRYCC|nr:calmodulin, putative [Trypanosoma cruzi]EAN89727.1 calmodulin, putative [Trypanosoma cruzi]KAF8281652.1 putative calmodulin [Trypanosoma cruzi]PWV17652.1 putative calmodulin [Trypanosoma cruzi]RNC58682.1 calmodulin [Trypanosoma cruzi]|eukprot:XP_811578.1 calmodulin [Trypanosoma cruzi strain CL Brener]